jgi:hypothetical protein
MIMQPMFALGDLKLEKWTAGIGVDVRVDDVIGVGEPLELVVLAAEVLELAVVTVTVLAAPPHPPRSSKSASGQSLTGSFRIWRGRLPAVDSPRPWGRFQS